MNYKHLNSENISKVLKEYNRVRISGIKIKKPQSQTLLIFTVYKDLNCENLISKN